jgi:hypothetical protein
METAIKDLVIMGNSFISVYMYIIGDSGFVE